MTNNRNNNRNHENNNHQIGDKPTSIEIGDRIDVTYRDGSVLAAEIVEKRNVPSERINASSSTTTNSDIDSSTMTRKANKVTAILSDQVLHVQYYVHYLNHDRRLDEWVDTSRLHMDTWDYSVRIAKLNEADDDAASTMGLNGTEIVMGSRGRKRKSTAKCDANTELEREHEERTKVKNIGKILIGKYEVETWYYSPYPDGYDMCDRLYICEFCLKYMKHKQTFRAHRDCVCKQNKPPGNEIYRDGKLSVFEIDGKEDRVYCQNLCLLAKLFLDHKTLYYDVDPFWFYIITEVDEDGAHVVGYFSKEKASMEDYNLACILTFPQHQKSGYGKFIISLSYELSKREKKVGSPEKPLSDLGKISYRSYWTYVLMHLFHSRSKAGTMKSLTLKEISTITAIKVEDILSTLQTLDMIKQWKGQHVIHVKKDFVQEYVQNSKPIRLCHSENLVWNGHESS